MLWYQYLDQHMGLMLLRPLQIGFFDLYVLMTFCLCLIHANSSSSESESSIRYLVSYLSNSKQCVSHPGKCSCKNCFTYSDWMSWSSTSFIASTHMHHFPVSEELVERMSMKIVRSCWVWLFIIEYLRTIILFEQNRNSLFRFHKSPGKFFGCVVV